MGFFALPVLALPALLTLTGVSPLRAAIGSRHLWAIWMIDSLVVVCSLFVITWMTALGAVVRAGAPTPLGFVIAVGYPVLDYLGITMLALLWVTGRVPPQLRVQLGLLGSGIVAVALSDSVFAYLVSSGAQEMPTITDAGFVAGPALIALAAAAHPGPGSPGDPARTAAVERTPAAIRRRWRSRAVPLTEVPLAEDQHPVRELGSDGQDEAFGEAVRPRTPRRDLDHLDACVRHDRVERRRELTGPIADQEPKPGGMLAEVHDEVAGLLGGPGPVGMSGHAQHV